MQSTDVNLFTHGRHASQMRHQKAADGLEAFTRDLDVQPLRHLVDVHLAVEEIPAVPFIDDRLGLDVVLIADLADDLLEHVLDGDQTGRAAVFVHHHGHLRLLPLELFEQFGHTLAFWHEHHRTE